MYHFELIPNPRVKFLGIIDFFWEQFLVTSPLAVNNGEVDTGLLDATREAH
jgi:hypothetical protein